MSSSSSFRDLLRQREYIRFWYARLGWVMWQGKLFIRTDEGLLPTPDDQIMIKTLPKSPALDLNGSLSAEWREGELW